MGYRVLVHLSTGYTVTLRDCPIEMACAKYWDDVMRRPNDSVNITDPLRPGMVISNRHIVYVEFPSDLENL
jgi:hypothetical protein